MGLAKKNVLSSDELSILKALYERQPIDEDSSVREISELGHWTGMHDKDDVLRALYTLEGKNLVSPEPAGDFTSQKWKITDLGERALQVLVLS